MDDKTMKKTFGGSPQCMKENLDYFIQKLKEQKQVKQHISYGRYEAPKLLKIEN